MCTHKTHTCGNDIVAAAAAAAFLCPHVQRHLARAPVFRTFAAPVVRPRFFLSGAAYFDPGGN